MNLFAFFINKASWVWEKGIFFWIVASVSITFSLYQIYENFTLNTPISIFRPVHLTWIMVIVFLIKPLWKNKKNPWNKMGRMIDMLLIIITVICGYFISTFDYNNINLFLSGLTFTYQLVGILFLCLLFEAGRRTVGWVLIGIAFIFLLYFYFGSLLPNWISTSSVNMSDILMNQIYSTNGIFGVPLAISAGAVFMFILFSSFLEVTGAGNFFINIAFALVGRFRGGPAKAGVVASAFMGSISGSAIANTVSTGSLTIPLMKKIGYKAEEAAGIEAAASTGGQIMPPIMGAGAFIMAQFTGINYGTIVLVSIIPALMYFSSVLLSVHLIAVKRDFKGLTIKERVFSLLWQGYPYFLPLIVIFVLLIIGFDPVIVGFWGTVSLILVSFIRWKSHISWVSFFKGLRKTAMTLAMISVACALSGVIVGVVAGTGLGLRLTSLITFFSGNNAYLAFLFVAIVALFLGTGLPVTASYIIISVMTVPALMHFGVSILTANLVIFWLAQTSNVTPPVALAAYAAAGIAETSPIKASYKAFRLAFGLIFIPLMMFFSPLVYYHGLSLWSYSFSILSTVLGIILLMSSYDGRLWFPIAWWMRGLFVIALIANVIPQWRLYGILFGMLLLGYHTFTYFKYKYK